MEAYIMSTEQTTVFPWNQQRHENRRQLQKHALNLSEFQNQNGHGSTVGNRVLQLCHDLSKSAFSFGETKPPLHFHTLTFIYEVLDSTPVFIFLRPAQCRTGQVNTVIPAVADILSVPIDLVRKNAAGIMSFPCTETSCHRLRISCLVVSVKGEALQSAPSVYNTDVNLGSKLRRRSGFSPIAARFRAR